MNLVICEACLSFEDSLEAIQLLLNLESLSDSCEAGLSMPELVENVEDRVNMQPILNLETFAYNFKKAQLNEKFAGPCETFEDNLNLFF